MSNKFESYYNIINNRYSCRKFKDELIKREELEKILEAGRLAPTAVNRQPQRIIVVENEEVIKVMQETFKHVFNAKTIIVVCYDKNEAWTRRYDDRCFGDVDSSIVATHMMLACEALDIGSCYVCSYDEIKLRNILGINDNYGVNCMLPIGYKDIDAQEKNRKKLEEIVTYR